MTVIFDVMDEFIFGLERSIEEIENLSIDALMYYYARAVKYNARKN